MNRDDAARELRVRYRRDDAWAEDILSLAAETGRHELGKHAVTCDETGSDYAIVPVPWSDHARPATAADGHELARQLIAKHERDRYPTPAAQYRKLLDEAGELGEALINLASGDRIHDGSSTAERIAITEDLQARARKEYADVGLSLYELGTKLGLNLLEAMAEVVAGETRTFPPGSGMDDQAARDNGSTG